MVGIAIKQAHRNSHIITHEVVKKGFEKWYLLSADWHLDNPMCRRDLLKKHFQQAQERDAGIFAFGDLFCAMQGRNDRRRSRGKDKMHTPDYFNSVVRDVVDFVKPYAPNHVLWSMGNHETAVQNYSDINLQTLAAQFISYETKHTIYTSGYEGWISFHFKRSQTSFMNTVKLKYMHGSGGSAPVTGGAIDQYRQVQGYHGADIVVSGHKHNSQYREFAIETLNNQLEPVLKPVFTVLTPTYKDEHKDGFGGWAVEKGISKKPLGAWWLRFYWENSETINFDLIAAK